MSSKCETRTITVASTISVRMPEQSNVRQIIPEREEGLRRQSVQMSTVGGVLKTMVATVTIHGEGIIPYQQEKKLKPNHPLKARSRR